MKQKSEININERAQFLLRVVVERYIRDGQPVGSKILAEETPLGLSSATIRNVLSELEEQGYLRSPYTSAGRVPTAQGYRFFVNALLANQPIDDAAVQQVKDQLKPNLVLNELVKSASNLLSELTQMVGVVRLPSRPQSILRHMEFLPLGSDRVLVVLVINENDVQNRIIYTKRVYAANELQTAGNFINQKYAGKDIRFIRDELLTAMHTDQENLNQMMQTALDIAGQAIDANSAKDDGYLVSGHNHLLDMANGSDINQLRQLFDAFTQKQDILHLLDQSLKADGVQIFIGEESGYKLLGDCSLITAPYTEGDNVIGVLGVIGPTRMSYDQVIPIVDITAKLLSAALNHGR